MSTAHSWHHRLRRRVLKVQPRQAPRAVALRNSLAVVAPLIAGVMSGHEQAGLGMATGALTVIFSDQPGPYRLRFRRLLLASMGGALAAFAGFSLGNQPLLFLPLVALWVFAASMLVALGQASTRVGLTSIIVLLITSSRSEMSAALPATALIFAGGISQALLAVLLWPFSPRRPQRQMLVDAYQSLARQLQARSDHDAAPPESSTINDLQDYLQAYGSSRSLRDEHLHLLVREYDYLRLAMVALSELESDLDRDCAQWLADWRELAAKVLKTTAQSMAGHHDQALIKTQLEDLTRGLQQTSSKLAPRLPDFRNQQWLDASSKLARHVRVVARNCQIGHPCAPVSADDDQEQIAIPLPLRPGRPINILAANLRWHSVAFRHAMRSTLIVTSCLAVVMHAGFDHGYWLPMTAAIILKPDFAATISAGVLRTAGTLVGLLVMTLLLHLVLTTPALRIATLAVLCFTFREWVPRNYGIGIAALSGMLVLMLALAGEPAMQLVEARASFTVAGCVIGLAGYLLWPSWERSRVRPALAEMLAAWSAYLHSLVDGDETHRSQMRQNARTARSNAQASLERLRHEPRTGEGLLDGGEALLVAGNRLARLAMQVDALLLERPKLRDDDSFCKLLTELADYGEQLAHVLADRQGMDPQALPRVMSRIKEFRDKLEAKPELAALRNTTERFEAITATLADVIQRLQAAPSPRRSWPV